MSEQFQLFWRAANVQRRVVHALLMREIITRFGRDDLGVLWLFLEPTLFTVAVTVLWTMSGLHHGSSLPIVAFAVTGYSCVLLWRNCATRVSHAIEANLSLLHHRNVQVIDLFVTRLIIEVAGATISFVMISMVAVAVDWMPPPEDILQVILGWLLLAWFGCALALTIGAATSYDEIVSRLWHPVSYILFPISGAGFMVEWLPTAMQEFVLWIPMVHGTEYIREGYFGNVVRTHYDLGYLALISLLLTWTGLFLVKNAKQHVRRG